MTNTVSDIDDRGSIHDVVARDMCVGCGACGVASGGKVSVTLGIRGQYRADITALDGSEIRSLSSVCPFSRFSRNEDEISADRYSELKYEEGIGFVRSMFAGRASGDSELLKTSSGGLTSWLTAKLLSSGEVDGIIHVGFGDQAMFAYRRSESLEQLLSDDGRKSRYYPVSFSEILNEIRGNGRRYAFVGVPCQVRGVRLLTEADDVLAAQIKYTVGLVCGHMKSERYAESLAWQQGITPSELAEVDFRVKDPEAGARGYKFASMGGAPRRRVETTTGRLVGGNWGHAVFQLNACNYCDDIFAETADIVFGDAWLPKYESEWRGTNVIVTRNERLHDLLLEGAEQSELSLEMLDASSVRATQAGNYRHRRDGLAVRLADDIAAGEWVPPKRVSPGYKHVRRSRVAVVRARRRLSAASHTIYERAREQGSLETYLREIAPYIVRHDRLSKIATLQQAGFLGAIGKVRRKVARALRRS